MEYNFAELVDLPGFQQVMQSWYSVAGVAAALLDTERQSLCSVGWQDICTLFHHLPPESAGRCTHSDDYLFSHLTADTYVTHLCPHGLMNSAMPVMVNDEHIATLVTGQFLHTRPDEPLVRQQAMELGIDAESYLAALQRIPTIAEDRLRVIMTAQVRLAEMLATLGWEHRQLLGTSATFNADLLRAQQHIALMLHTAQMASSTLEPGQVLERVADALLAAVDVPYCGIYLLDPERGLLVPHVVRGPLNGTDLVELRKQNLDPLVESLGHEALAQQSPAVWYDAADDPRISQEVAQAWNIKSVLAVPIRVSAKVLGLALLSTSSDYRQFTPDEIELVWGIANSVALAVDNARLYAETRQRLAESQGLQRVAAALLHKISPEEVLEIVCAEVQQLTGATGSAILLVEDNSWLRVAYSSGTEEHAFFERIPIAGALAGVTVRQNESYLTNAPADESFEYLHGKRPTAYLSVPLHANGDVIGVLEVIDKPNGFVNDDIRIVSLFANQATINIEHARLNQQARQVAVLEERQRLARELHDSVVQSLYSMGLYADAAALALVAGKPGVTEQHLHELRDTSQNAMRDMRLLIFELHPPALEKEGLVTALRVRLASVEARAGVEVEFEVERERRLPIEIEQELYRIAQEALNNIMKHARAQHVKMSLQFQPQNVRLQISDDGEGFDPESVQNSGGMGLPSFIARAAKIDGSVNVDSHPGQGTTVTVNVAVAHEEIL